jgi:hypothetical protein
VILTVAVLVFLGAAIIQIVESIGDQAQELDFHQAVYFIVVVRSPSSHKIPETIELTLL